MNETYEQWRLTECPEFIFQLENVRFEKSSLWISISNGDRPFKVGDKFGGSEILGIYVAGKAQEVCPANSTAVIRIDQMPTLTVIGEYPMEKMWPPNPTQSTSQKLNHIKNLVQEWLNKQSHQRCWYYPEIFNKVAEYLGLKQELPSELPSRCEFEEGCKRYQDEEYGTKKLPGYYEDIRLCHICDRETPHECKDSGHERDSSMDYQKCLICKHYKFGMSSDYGKPDDEEAIKIIINGKPIEIISDYLDYDEIMKLAYGKVMEGCSIVYFYRKTAQSDIFTKDKEPLKVNSDLVIDAIFTGNA